ncbi:MAG TPA: 5-formyltetrahydrofolate cyclo-ligase [Thermoprotei archaeon]|nr:5-formyltetrahydrofolate cyclo-ligase [Thermoprotei archaeon]
MCNRDIKSIKQSLREKIWSLMEERDIALFPRPVHGRIPNFKGADRAAMRLFLLDIWRSAKVVKVNPDSPQKHVRFRALLEGKILLMPTPKLRKGFLLLDPKRIPRGDYNYASTIKGAFKYGRTVPLNNIPRVDLIVTGSVLVDLYGNRIGKGGGYGDLEYGILVELGKVTLKTPIITTVHDVQISEEPLPYEEHDIVVDLIVTPTRTLKTIKKREKPKGILWDRVTDDMLEKIPILGVLKRKDKK